MSALPIPTAALDDRLGFLGTSGSGKTYAASGAVERLLHRKARVVIVDPLGVWWGLRLLADGKKQSSYDVAIFGGPHGDLPLTENSGALIGETAATMAESCIIDLSELRGKTAERRFMTAFLDTIYLKTTKEPFHLIVDEADLFAPQKPAKGAETLLGHMEDIVRRGRVKGFIPWLISQRPAVINKNVLSQVDGLIAFKLTATQDRDALDDWIEGQADKGQGKEIKASLPTLQVGQGVVWLPGHGILKTGQFPEKTTFDSSRTPKRGEKLKRRTLKPLDLGQLKGRLAAVEQEAKANDPRKLRTEIAALKAEKTKLENQVATAKPIADRDALVAAQQKGFEKAKKQFGPAATRALNKAIMSMMKSVTTHVDATTQQLRETLAGDFKALRASLPGLDTEITFVPDAPIAAPAPRPQSRPAFASANSSVAPKSAAQLKRIASNGSSGAPAETGELGKGERIVLIAIAQYPEGAAREQLTVLTGYKKSSRDTYIQRLGAGGLVEIAGNGVRATDAGVAALGADYEPLPTGSALQAYWLDRLSGGEQKILAYLVDLHPNAVARSDLDEPTGYKKSARDTYVQRLAARMLITADRGQVRAADMLFD